MMCVKQWLTASVFLMSIALAMAELASSAPTSGGVRTSIHMLVATFLIVISFIFGPIRLLPRVGELYSAG
jgi:amino acid transporter